MNMKTHAEIEVINKIKDALGVDFAWHMPSYGMVLPTESLQIILSGVERLTDELYLAHEALRREMA
jgi:hypothetical protein